MANLISNQFQAALNHLLRQEGRGAQIRLSIEQNIDRGYLNAIIKGRKPGAEDIRARIATHFGMAYDEMLAFGRRILEGVEAKEGGGQEVRLPKNSAKIEEAVFGGIDNEIGNKPCEKTSEKIQRVLEILDSGTEHGILFSAVIDAYHQAILTNRKNKMIENRLEEMESRLEQLEKVFTSKKAVDQRSKRKISKRD